MSSDEKRGSRRPNIFAFPRLLYLLSGWRLNVSEVLDGRQSESFSSIRSWQSVKKVRDHDMIFGNFMFMVRSVSSQVFGCLECV